MSSNTKQVLAITLGAVGLIIGIFAMITAYNAKQASESDAEVSSLVEARFASAQDRQDQLEAKQASDAEKLISGLSSKEKGLVKRLNSNAGAVKNLRKKTSNQQAQINSLNSRDGELTNELSRQEQTQQNDFNTLSGRIKRLNGEINDFQQGLNTLKKRINNLIGSGS